MRTVDVTPKKQNDEGCTVRLGASVPPVNLQPEITLDFFGRRMVEKGRV